MGIVLLIALIIGVFFLVQWIMKSSKQGRHQPGAGDSALEILKKRYASGEINKEEFEEQKKDIEK
jgi:putative membrane protein